jgi:predicted RecA/RadA family phage recombinase
VDTTLDYSRMPIRGLEYLLPKATRQRFIGRDGTEGENSVSFAACREFQGESTLTFRRPAGTELFVDPPPVPALPSGLALAIEMTSSFAFGQAAAGNRIEGHLVEALRDPKAQKMLAPAGAKVAGRLTRVELKHSGSGEYTVALRWETLQAGGETVPLNLKPDRHMEGSKAVARGVLRQRGMAIELPPPDEERDAIYHFAGQLAGVRSGLR